MKKLFFILISVFIVAGCALNLVTGRNQLSLVKESELQLMATAQYNTFLTGNKVLNPGNNRDAAMVDRVGARIANAITRYYDKEGKETVLDRKSVV